MPIYMSTVGLAGVNRTVPKSFISHVKFGVKLEKQKESFTSGGIRDETVADGE